MIWQTVAEFNSVEEMQAYVSDYDLPHGTKVRATMNFSIPIAPLFDIAGAELIAQQMMGDEIKVTDVYSPDGIFSTTGVVEGEVNSPALLMGIVVGLLAVMSVVGLGVLAYMLLCKLEVMLPELMRLWILGMAVAGVSIVAALYIRYRTKALEGKKRRRR